MFIAVIALGLGLGLYGVLGEAERGDIGQSPQAANWRGDASSDDVTNTLAVVTTGGPQEEPKLPPVVADPRGDEIPDVETTTLADAVTGAAHEEPPPPPIACNEDQQPDGQICVPLCPEGTKFIKGGSRGMKVEQEGTARDINYSCQKVAEQPPTPPAPPTKRSKGRLDKTLAARNRELKICLDRHGGDYTEKTLVRFTIDRDGSVSAISAEDPGLGHEYVECVVTMLGRVQFSPGIVQRESRYLALPNTK